MTTDKEQEICSLLTKALREFKQLDDHDGHDVMEFITIIRQARSKIAMRVARRADPHWWGNQSRDTER